MSKISDYYLKNSIPFGISGDRLAKTLPLISNIRNKKILDVGCSSGFLSSRLKEQGNYVIGLDINPKDVAKARKILDEAFTFDIDSEDKKEFKGKFDLIIMSEVVEHLFDPDNAIKKASTWLRSGGQMLISTPNFVHLYNRLRILFGIFEYRHETIINMSHIHFYTHDSLKKAIENSNMEIIKENDVVFPRTLSQLWKYWPSLFSYQFVFLCKKNNE